MAKVPLLPEMALDLLTSVLGECVLAGVTFGVQQAGDEVVLRIVGARIVVQVQDGKVLIVPALAAPAEWAKPGGAPIAINGVPR
jgi:hypothetical protein